jgi:hypothetical protein
MKLRDLLGARRRKKAHRRYLQERERQQALQGRDPQEVVRDVARGPGAVQQGPYSS